MKILIVGPKWVGGWLEGVKAGVQSLGHEALTYAYTTPHALSADKNRLLTASYTPPFLHELLRPVAEGVGSMWEHSMNLKLIQVSVGYRPDLVLILKGELLQVDTLKALKMSGAYVFSWWLDDPILYLRDYPQVADQLQMVDAFFLFDEGGFDELKKHGVSAFFYLPCACDLNVYYPKVVSAYDRKRFQCDIGFVANYYPERGKLIKQLQGSNVAIWGSGWKKSTEFKTFSSGVVRGKRLSGIEVSKVYNVAKICPNIHHSQSRIGGLNMRTFEIPAAGGFEITDYVPGIEKQFEIGSEMIVYRSPEDFRELVDYYLDHPEERSAIVKRGRERVLRDHTYEQRMKSMLEVLK